MSRRSSRRARRGAHLVECGLVYPMALLLMIGTIVMGLGVFRQQQIARLSRAGARWAAVHGPTYQSERGRPAPTSADVRAAVISSKHAGLKDSQLTCTLTMTGQTATVTVTYRWVPEGFFRPVTLSSTSVQPITY